MKIEIILLGTIGLVFLVDFIVKKNKKNRDVTVYKPKKVKSKIKYFLFFGVLLFSSIAYFIAYPFYVFLKAGQKIDEGAFLEASELYEKSMSISPVFVKNDSLKLTSIASFSKKISDKDYGSNQNKVETIKLAIDKIDYIISKDSINDSSNKYTNRIDLIITQVKLLVEFNLLTRGLDRGLKNLTWRTDDITTEESKAGILRRTLKDFLNEIEPNLKTYEFLGKFLFDLESYDSFLQNKENLSSEDYIEAISTTFFEFPIGNRSVFDERNVYLKKWLKELDRLSNNSSAPILVLVKNYLSRMDKWRLILSEKVKEKEYEFSKYDIYRHLDNSSPKNLLDVLIYINMVDELCFYGVKPEQLNYYTKILKLLEELKEGNLNSEFVLTYGKETFERFYYQNFVSFNSYIADVNQKLGLNKLVIADTKKVIEFLLSIETKYYDNNQINLDLSSQYYYMASSKWNIKPYGNKFGYCEDIEKALAYELKSSYQSEFSINHITSLLKKDCN